MKSGEKNHFCQGSFWWESTSSAQFLSLTDTMQQQIGRKEVLEFSTTYAVVAKHQLYKVVELERNDFLLLIYLHFCSTTWWRLELVTQRTNNFLVWCPWFLKALASISWVWVNQGWPGGFLFFLLCIQTLVKRKIRKLPCLLSHCLNLLHSFVIILSLRRGART